MDRVVAIWRHPLYQSYYRKLEQLERERVFCRHQMIHLLDVARIAYIRNLEEGLGLQKELIYAGVEIAEQILSGLPEELSFTEGEKGQILTAIKGHRRLREDAKPLERLLYESDKESRMCFACPAEAQCDWSKEKKNMEIKV